MGMKPVWTVVQKGRGISLANANCSNWGAVETESLELFSQFAGAQSMMHPFSDKVARARSYLIVQGTSFQKVQLTIERLAAL